MTAQDRPDGVSGQARAEGGAGRGFPGLPEPLPHQIGEGIEVHTSHSGTCTTLQLPPGEPGADSSSQKARINT